MAGHGGGGGGVSGGRVSGGPSERVERERLVAAKVCGVMTPGDAAVVGGAGADFMGVILSPGYGRSVAAERAGAIYEAASARRVGVFVDADADDVIRIAAALDLDVVQLGGRETADAVARIGAAGGWGVWKTVHARAGQSPAGAAGSYAGVANGILLDSWDPRRPGGTGKAFSWTGVGDEVRRAIGGATFIAAGGMTPDNAAEAVRALRPDVLDVSSGVEAAHGTKDPDRTRAFVRAVKRAGREVGGDRDRQAGAVRRAPADLRATGDDDPDPFQGGER